MIKIDSFTNGIIGANVRAFVSEGEIYFVANDLAKSLEYGKVGKMYEKIPDEYKVNVSSIDGYKLLLKNGALGNRSILITEAGVYAAIFRSKKKEAVKFQRWIFEDVLPTLRKTGVYVHELATPEQINFSAENGILRALARDEYIGRRFKAMSIDKSALVLKQSVAYIVTNTLSKNKDYVLSSLTRAVKDLKENYKDSDGFDLANYSNYSEVLNYLSNETKKRSARVYGQKLRRAKDDSYSMKWVEVERLSLPIFKKSLKKTYFPIRQKSFNYGKVLIQVGLWEAKGDAKYPYINIKYSKSYHKLGEIKSPTDEVEVLGTRFKYDYDTNEIIISEKKLTKNVKVA